MATSNHKAKLFFHLSAMPLVISMVALGVVMMLNPVMLGGARRTPIASRVGLSMVCIKIPVYIQRVHE